MHKHSHTRDTHTVYELHTPMHAHTHKNSLESYLIVMRRQLIQELFDSELLSGTVNIRDLVLWQTGEVQLDLDHRQQNRDV